SRGDSDGADYGIHPGTSSAHSFARRTEHIARAERDQCPPRLSRRTSIQADDWPSYLRLPGRHAPSVVRTAPVARHRRPRCGDVSIYVQFFRRARRVKLLVRMQHEADILAGKSILCYFPTMIFTRNEKPPRLLSLHAADTPVVPSMGAAVS